MDCIITLQWKDTYHIAVKGHLCISAHVESRHFSFEASHNIDWSVYYGLNFTQVSIDNRAMTVAEFGSYKQIHPTFV